MNEIDWSKAPHGANGYVPREGSAPALWYRKAETKSLVLDYMPAEAPGGWKTSIDPRPNITWREEVLEPWIGEGLPPVGTICKLAGPSASLQPIHPEWAGREVKIYSHFTSDRGVEMAAYVSPDHMIGGCGVSLLFEPIPTAEQIKAEERRVAIQAITKVLQQERCAGDDDGSLSAEALWDAGYRKVEGGDRQAEALQVAVRALKRLEAEPGCGCPTPCQCSGPEWSRAEIEGRMGEAEEALRRIEQIQGGAA